MHAGGQAHRNPLPALALGAIRGRKLLEECLREQGRGAGSSGSAQVENSWRGEDEGKLWQRQCRSVGKAGKTASSWADGQSGQRDWRGGRAGPAGGWAGRQVTLMNPGCCMVTCCHTSCGQRTVSSRSHPGAGEHSGGASLRGYTIGRRAGSHRTHLHVCVASGDCLLVVLCHSILLGHLQRELQLHLRSKRKCNSGGSGNATA